MEEPKINDLGKHIQRVGMIFSGGPAPGANAVISSAAISFLDSGREVIGFLNGYEHLQNYHQLSSRLQYGIHYRPLTLADVAGTAAGSSSAPPGPIPAARSRRPRISRTPRRSSCCATSTSP